MTPKFQNADELKEYLEKLEARIVELESQSSGVPKTNIVSNNFIKRAFAIWGHYMTANIIIASIVWVVTIVIIYFAFTPTFLNTVVNSPFFQTTRFGVPTLVSTPCQDNGKVKCIPSLEETQMPLAGFEETAMPLFITSTPAP